MRTKLLVFLLFMSVNFYVRAQTANSEEQMELIEQEFRSIDLDNGFDEKNEDSDGKFKFVEQNNTKVKQITIRNEFYESLKILLTSEDNKAELNDIEIYINAYETKNTINISKNIKYKVEVYNLYDEYLGHIYNANTQKNNKISISPFLLIADKKESPKEDGKTLKIKEAKEQVKQSDENNEELEQPAEFQAITESTNFSDKIITHKETEETKIFRETEEKASELESKEITSASEIPETEIPKPKEIEINNKKINNFIKPNSQLDIKARTIKVANISDSSVHIDMLDPEGKPIGGGWTIDNDIYVPQYLNLESKPVSIEPDVKLLINNIKSKEILTKFAKELNIDEKGNYVWFID